MSTTSAIETVTPADVVGAGLSFDRTVSRSLVHKRAIEEVLLSDFKQIGEDDILCAGHLPRSHSCLSDVCTPYYDLAPIGEAIRQSALLIGHCFLDVSDDSHYIFRRVENTLDYVDEAEALRVGDEPSELIVHFGVRNKRVRRGAVSSYEGHITVYVNGVRAGGGFGFGSLMALTAYNSFRRQMREAAVVTDGTAACVEPLDPVRVGRRDVRNVVIGELAAAVTDFAYTGALVVRPDHRFFFDHPQDHVPGNLLIEAIRQMSIASACAQHGLPPDGVVVGHMSAEFIGFTELDLRTTVSAEVGALRRARDGQALVPVQISISRAGVLSAQGEATVVGLERR